MNTYYIKIIFLLCCVLTILGLHTAEAFTHEMLAGPKVVSVSAASETESRLIVNSCENDGDGCSIFYSRPFISNTLGRNREILMTFDDGPHPNTTPAILDILQKYNVKAIFFLVGTNVRKYPELVRRIHDEGHTIGNHTAHHANLTHVSLPKAREEMRSLNELVEQIAGVKPSVFRPPYGAVNQNICRIAAEEGMDTMLWTVDPYDWRNRSAVRTCENVKRQLRLGGGSRGGVILMHDTLPTTVAALEPLLIAFVENDLILTAYAKCQPNGRIYWAPKSPVVIEWVKYRPLNFKLMDRPFIAYILDEGKNSSSYSAVSLLKARKTGTLFETLLCQAY